jgi:sugar phosphate isomerase/epimerase
MLRAMKSTPFVALGAALLLSISVVHTEAASKKNAGVGKSFKGPIGIQLYSLRAEFTRYGVPNTLDKVAAYGIKNVELYTTFDMKPAAFAKELKQRGLNPVSSHFPYNRLRDDIDGVVADAKALGLKYAGCAWAAHKGDYSLEACRENIDVFNKAGRALAKIGVKFFYHLHGFEFQPHGEGTLADVLISGTDQDAVFFQMDVLWVVFPGQDPVALLKKYPKRWKLMHVKDLKKGVETGSLAGKTDVTNDAQIGTGQVDWPAVLKAAKEVGVEQYYLEDESPWAVDQIKGSLAYLAKLKF